MKEEIDLTHSHDQYPVLNSSYQIGGLYRTMMPLYIVGNVASDIFFLEKEGGVNPFISDYESDPDRYKKIKQYKNIQGVICEGTLIKAMKLEYHSSQGSSAAGTTAYAKIIGGTFDGFTVNLMGISGFLYATPVGILEIPNPKYISEESGEGASAGPVK